MPLLSRAVEELSSLSRTDDGLVFRSLWSRLSMLGPERGIGRGLVISIRHEATSRLAERGWNVLELAAVTGHSDLQMLKRYTNLRAADLARKMG